MITGKLNKEICRIFLIAYTHCDYAWGHTRKWHKNKYVQAFEKILVIMKKNEDFKWYIDTFFEEFSPFIQKSPKKLVELKRWINKGRIEITSGTVSNPQIDLIGGETFIRNIAYGIRYFKHYIPEILPLVYTAIDLFPGHSQIPQLLKKGGYKYFGFSRPIVDEPKEFYWKGLDGTEILCGGRGYGSSVFHHPNKFPYDYKKDWNNYSADLN